MLNFPDAPVVNQTYTDGTTAWKWDGAKWVTTLTLNSVSPPSSNLDAGIKLQSAGRDRWWVHLNGIEGGGANFGSNFVVNRHDDAGVWLDSPLVISRWSGIVSFTASPTGPTPAASDSSSKFATTAFAAPRASPTFTGTVTTVNLIATTSFNLGSATAPSVTLGVNSLPGNNRLLQFSSADVARWKVGALGAAENPGTNVGSNFVINRYDDSGNSLGTVLTLTRSTGAAVFGGDLTVSGTFTGSGAVNALNLTVTNSATFGSNTATNAGTITNGATSTSRLHLINTAGVVRWKFGADATAWARPGKSSIRPLVRCAGSSLRPQPPKPPAMWARITPSVGATIRAHISICR
jgi:hypothetical protein